MSTTRREILKAAPLALLSGGFAIPLLSAFTDDDLKKAEKGKVIGQEAKSIEVSVWHPGAEIERFKNWTVFASRSSTILTLGPATLDGHPCEIVGLNAIKEGATYFPHPPRQDHWYMLEFQDLVAINTTHPTFILSQTI